MRVAAPRENTKNIPNIVFRQAAVSQDLLNFFKTPTVKIKSLLHVLPVPGEMRYPYCLVSFITGRPVWDSSKQYPPVPEQASEAAERRRRWLHTQTHMQRQDKLLER